MIKLLVIKLTIIYIIINNPPHLSIMLFRSDMVFSKSEDSQREWREPANEANKPR